ncbi:DUF4190 domain-containing protein [Caproiciproducens sp. MSJ-32]|uniref:DUF4190 domain-containing protein n=1 Tax=Caproiciproducens sp. MSJ-32 TaxID=2841527 RepID=UPI001C0F7EA0|nr:DUF4190 domain-containing protein [Caproiciproducens sp. MSJ-32]MBU5455321.1 DUF4190 domain-containing protein [Caproiciproducens sp. MSJ-32]
MGEQYNNFPQMQDNGTNALAITGFILGLISWFLNFFGIVAILAIIFSAISFSQIKRKNQKGKVFAIIGLISGIANLIYAFVIISSTLSFL